MGLWSDANGESDAVQQTGGVEGGAAPPATDRPGLRITSDQEGLGPRAWKYIRRAGRELV